MPLNTPYLQFASKVVIDSTLCHSTELSVRGYTAFYS